MNFDPVSQNVSSPSSFGVIFNGFVAGSYPMTFQWQKQTSTGEWEDTLDDHCEFFNAGIFNYKGTSGYQLRLGNQDGIWQGIYRCHIINSCGEAFTGPAAITCATGCPCSADFDGSGGTPDSGDIDGFFGAWLAGDPVSDVDCSGGTPDSSDIDVFFLQWLAGGCSTESG